MENNIENEKDDKKETGKKLIQFEIDSETYDILNSLKNTVHINRQYLIKTGIKMLDLLVKEWIDGASIYSESSKNKTIHGGFDIVRQKIELPGILDGMGK